MIVLMIVLMTVLVHFARLFYDKHSLDRFIHSFLYMSTRNIYFIPEFLSSESPHLNFNIVAYCLLKLLLLIAT